MDDELRMRIKRMIVERLFLDVTPREIEDDALLMETYGIDSIALSELVVGLEEEFDVALEDTDSHNDVFKSIDSIAAFLHGRGVA